MEQSIPTQRRSRRRWVPWLVAAAIGLGLIGYGFTLIAPPPTSLSLTGKVWQWTAYGDDLAPVQSRILSATPSSSTKMGPRLSRQTAIDRRGVTRSQGPSYDPRFGCNRTRKNGPRAHQALGLSSLLITCGRPTPSVSRPIAWNSIGTTTESVGPSRSKRLPDALEHSTGGTCRTAISVGQRPTGRVSSPRPRS